MVDKTKLAWIRTGGERVFQPAVIIRAASQGDRCDVIEIAIDRQWLADRGMGVGDRVKFALDPDDMSRLYLAPADDGKGYAIGRAGRYATRIVVSGRYARAIWHLIGTYMNVHDAGDGIYYIQQEETAEGQQ